MIYWILGVLIVVLDFVTKRLAVDKLTTIDTIPLIRNVFHLTYVENRGAAFGILADKRAVFIALTAVILAVLIAAAVRLKDKTRPMCIGFCFVCAGAVGNLIDRVRLGFVVDFFDFRLINFPVFNVADIFVCIGAAVLAGAFIVYDEKRDKDRKYENSNR